MQAVILAAGRGSRLWPFTLFRSKASLKIWGKPLIGRVVDSFLGAGIKKYVIVIPPEDDRIARYLKKQYGSIADFEFQEDQLRTGMATALNQAASSIRDDFILSACDSWITSKDNSKMLSRWGEDQDKDGLLAVWPVPQDLVKSSSSVRLEGERVLGIIEKPDPSQMFSGLASISPYYFTPRILEYLPKVSRSQRGEFELQEAISMLITDGYRVDAEIVSKRWNITTPYDWFRMHFSPRILQDRPGSGGL